MLDSRSVAVIAALSFWLASGPLLAQVDGAVRADAPGEVMWRRTTFVIGAPGRLDSEGDRRLPRLYQRADSAVAAYADIEEVQDRTWLRHEIEHYARRAVDCGGVGPAWCRREVQRVGSALVIALASGAHAELVWLSGNRAVRLGWRRIVDTRLGTMTLDTPPADFAGAQLAEFPSQLEAFEFDPGHDRVWAATEADRLLYYIDQVVGGLPGVVREEHRRRALRFVEDGLAQIIRLRVLHLGAISGTELVPRPDTLAVAPASAALPARLAEQLEAIRAWRADVGAAPWCTAQLTSSVPMSPAAGWQPSPW